MTEPRLVAHIARGGRCWSALRQHCRSPAAAPSAPPPTFCAYSCANPRSPDSPTSSGRPRRRARGARRADAAAKVDAAVGAGPRAIDEGLGVVAGGPAPVAVRAAVLQLCVPQVRPGGA